jgi:hypothetical protein
MTSRVLMVRLPDAWTFHQVEQGRRTIPAMLGKFGFADAGKALADLDVGACELDARQWAAYAAHYRARLAQP